MHKESEIKSLPVTSVSLVAEISSDGQSTERFFFHKWYTVQLQHFEDWHFSACWVILAFSYSTKLQHDHKTFHVCAPV